MTDQAVALIEKYPNAKLIRIVLSLCLNDSWIKVTAIEEEKDIDSMRIDEFIGWLQTLKMNL